MIGWLIFSIVGIIYIGIFIKKIFNNDNVNIEEKIYDSINMDLRRALIETVGIDRAKDICNNFDNIRNVVLSDFMTYSEHIMFSNKLLKIWSEKYEDR